MKWFPVHILIKDLSFMVFYFILMKYNLTNETYLPQTIKSFPGAADMTFVNMVAVSMFYNIIPCMISFATYYLIVSIFRNIFKKSSPLSLIAIGFFLTLTTPITYLAFSNWKHNDYYLIKAEIIAWTLCFVVSIFSYYLLNKRSLKQSALEVGQEEK